MSLEAPHATAVYSPAPHTRQALHTVLETPEHAWPTYLPTGHVLQAAHAVSPLLVHGRVW